MWRDKNPNPIISYVNLRKALGILGMILPLLCFFGGYIFDNLPLQQSISSYYYFNARDFFVGILIAVGVFMITYKGYEYIDNYITNIIGLSALGIAIFPCLYTIDPGSYVGYFQLPSTISNIIHLTSASVFFILLSINSIFIFTLSAGKKTVNKKKRNIIYVTCGVIILICLITLFVLFIFMSQVEIDQAKLVFIFETIMLEAFGISWLIKGETFLRD